MGGSWWRRRVGQSIRQFLYIASPSLSGFTTAGQNSLSVWEESG